MVGVSVPVTGVPIDVPMKVSALAMSRRMCVASAIPIGLPLESRARREFHFAREALGRQSLGEFRRDDLDDYRATECRFRRDDDARHPTAAKLTLHSVPGTERRLQR